MFTWDAYNMAWWGGFFWGSNGFNWHFIQTAFTILHLGEFTECVVGFFEAQIVCTKYRYHHYNMKTTFWNTATATLLYCTEYTTISSLDNFTTSITCINWKNQTLHWYIYYVVLHNSTSDPCCYCRRCICVAGALKPKSW